MQGRVEPNELRKLHGPMAEGAKVQLERIAVGDTVRTFDLERFEVWAPNAELVLDRGDGTTEKLERPAVNYYRGTVDGDPDSMVFLAVGADGTAQGLVVADEVRYRMRTNDKREVTIDESDPLDDFPIDGSFSCGVDGLTMGGKKGVPSVKADALGGVAAEGTLSATATYTLNLAIETDYELYQDMGSNPATVTTFIGNVIGAVSTIYSRDLRTNVVIAFSRVQSSASDPFTINPGSSGLWNGSTQTYSTSHALAELGDLWHNSGTRPFNGPRSSVVLMSGKSQTAGVAWIGTSCGGDFSCSSGNCGSAVFDGHWAGGYAYIGLGNPSTTIPNPDATVGGIQYGLSANYWPVLGVAHELGHNIDGPHTHCFSLTPAQKTQYSVTRDYIDICVTGCYSGATSVPPEKGTVMSYCHLLGSSQSRFLMGKAGEVSELMKNHLMEYINSVTPNSRSITAPASMGTGTSSNASVVSPIAGITYDWSITNGTINGSTTGTTINFTAGTNPVTLRVKGTSSNGCASTDYVNVAVSSCTAPVLTTVLPVSHAITLGTSVELNATATGSGPITYQWYVGTSGNTSTPAAPGNGISASPTSTTNYWVRATNSCGSVDSATITVTVITPPSTTSMLYVLQPCRLLDTRNTTPIANGATRDIQITGICGIPSTAKAAVVNIPVVSPVADGYLGFYPTGGSWLGTSTVAYRVGKTRTNNAILALSAGGSTTVLNIGGTQNFIIDVTGYFE
ncbi:MAG TPA: M12 family metallo-peptidase [Thermoanaerobaculia bacterium]|nr:M12 family metallo-peptidase [Thermoanaerobaculia bacterium]